jgi:hypothetical protein
MNKLNAPIQNFTARRPEHSADQLRPRPTNSDDAKRRANPRYRVDAAYRTYQPPANNEAMQSAASGRLRKIGSAALLNSMIHQMGGALTSSARGTFVDISI